MKRYVGIATMSLWALRHNYGTFLQHLALRRIVEALGYQPYRIDTGKMQEGWGFWLYPIRALLSWWFKSGSAVRFHRSLIGLLHWWKFNADYKKYIGPIKEVQQKDCYAVITGSDQIWWLGHRCFDPFLESEYGNAIKLSYAASADWLLMGASAEWREKILGVGKRFTGISVREHQGELLCREIIPDRHVMHVVDPTLLLGRNTWEEVVPNQRFFQRKTLFCYVVNCNDQSVLSIDELIETAKAMSLDLKIVAIQGTEMIVPRRYLVDLSPIEFVCAIRDAEYVLINSFHGLMFSLIYNKRFAFLGQSDTCTWNKNIRWDQNARQREVLTDYCLKDREIRGKLNRDVLQGIFSASIDWVEVNRRIDAKRSISRNWLESILTNKTDKGL